MEDTEDGLTEKLNACDREMETKIMNDDERLTRVAEVLTAKHHTETIEEEPTSTPEEVTFYCGDNVSPGENKRKHVSYKQSCSFSYNAVLISFTINVMCCLEIKYYCSVLGKKSAKDYYS